MRRNELDLPSQVVKNLITNPAMVTKTSGTDTVLVNYAANPTFEGATHHTGGIGGSPATFTTNAISTDRAHSGTKSYKKGGCTVAGQASLKAMTNPSGALKVMKGQRLSWSFWVYSTVAGTISPYWEGRKVSDNSYTGGGVTAISVPANTWTYIAATSSPVAQDSYADGAGGYNLAVNVGDSVWFDDFCITKTDAPVPYFDGSTPAADGYVYSWEGVAHQSSSIRKASASVVRTNHVANPSFKGGTSSTVRTNHIRNASFRATSGYTEVRKNLALNPSMEATSGTATVRTNLVTHPSFELSSGTTTVRTNYVENPSMETSGSAVVVRKNLAHDPKATVDNTTWGIAGWKTSRWFGGGSGAGTHTFVTGAADGPVSGLSTYLRKTWTASGNTNGDTGFEHTYGGVNGVPVTEGTTYTVSSYLRPSGLRYGAIQLNFYDSAGALLLTSVPAAGNTALPAGVWTRMIHTVAAPVSAVSMHAISDIDSGTLWAPGDTLDGTGLLIEEASIDLPYFDGSTAAADNLTYAWTGTANASNSEQRGVNVSGRIGLPPNGTSWQSTVRALYGTKSSAVLLKRPLADNATVWYPASDYTVGNAAGQIPANTQVTWSAYVYIPTGSAFKVGLMEVTSGVRGTPSATLYDQWQRISMTFTTPASGTVFLRMRTSGTVPAGATLWVDAEMIDATSQPRPYFDASNPIRNLADNPSLEVNADGWATNDGSLYPVSRSTVSPIRGTASLLATRTSTSPSTIVCSIYANGKSPTNVTALKVKPGEVYSFSLDVKVSQSNRRANTYLAFRDSAGASIGTAGTVNTNLTSGVVTRVGSAGVTVPPNADSMLAVISVSTTDATNALTNEQVWFDGLLIERSANISPYYEGQGDFTHAWTGVADASSSTQSAPSVTGWAGLGSLYRSALDPKVGSYSGAILTRGLNGDGLWPAANVDVIAGRTYTLSVWVKTTTSHALTAGFRWSDAAFVGIGSDFNVSLTSQLSVGAWSLVSATATAPTNAAKLQMLLRVYETHTPTTFYLDGAIIVESNTAVPYFDGATTTSGDFTYAWSGTANASTSLQRGVGVTETASGSVAPISSTEWKGLGTKSLRLIPTISHTSDTFTGFSGDTGAMRLGLVAGKTYTFSGTCRLSAPLTGTLSARSRRIVLFYKAAADPGYTEVQSTQAPNVAGETRVSLTFTIPSTAAEAFVRLYNGAMAGNGDVWWDNVLIEETATLRPYFDGTNPAVQNLAKTAPSAYNGLTATTGVSYAGETWTRGTVAAGPNTGAMFRQFVDLADLRQGERYTVSVKVANDQATAQTINLDWGDTSSTPFTIQPGEVKRIAVYGARTTYDNTFRFADLDVTVSATESRSILVKDWLVELGQTDGLTYYTGSKEFTHVWSGAANTSTSLQQAPALVGNIANRNGAATNSQFLTYQSIDENGKKISRWIAPANSTDSAWRIAGINTVSINYSAIVAGETYTFIMRYRSSGWIAASKVYISMRDADSTNIVMSQEERDLNTGWTEYRRTFTAAINGLASTNVYLSLPTIPSTTTDGVFDVSEMALVKGAYSGSFFDGATAASGDFTYAWETTADASISHQKAISLAGWTTESKLAAYITTSGTLKIEVKEPNGGGGRSIIPWSSANINLDLVSGATYTIKARGRKLDSSTGYRVAGALTGALPLTTTMSDISVTLTAGTGATYLEHPSGLNTAGTEWEYFGIFNGGDVTYFDGDTTGSSGLSYRWKGTPNVSQSEQIGAAVEGFNMEPNIRRWSLPDGAMRAVNISGTTHSLQSAAVMSVGRVYTILFRAKTYLSANINVYGMGTAKPVTLTTSYDWYRVTGVASDTIAYFSTSGGISGAGFDISHMMIVEGTYSGGYLDGSSYGSRWEGTAQASVSVGVSNSLESLAGKPLFVGTTPNTTTVLNSSAIADTAPRTIYSIVDNILDIPTGSLDAVLLYGVSSLDDTVPNKYLTIRMQSMDGPFNTNLIRRTGGGGPQKLGVPSSGRQILIGGIDSNAYLFSGFNTSTLLGDSLAMSIPHEKVTIATNTSYHQHVITYIYAGYHDDLMRAEIVKLLALKHNVNLNPGY